jgi:alpha-L-rhamnosidase
LYGKDYSEKTYRIFDKVREQSYYKGFFRDHSVRQKSGELQLIEEDVSETCQYYAFFSGVTSPERDPQLWDRMVNEFGAERIEKGLWEEVYPSNAFIGYYLRLELLMKQKLKDIVLKDIEIFFYHMAEATGTLWENKTAHASCNHGFASYVAVLLRELL